MRVAFGIAVGALLMVGTTTTFAQSTAGRGGVSELKTLGGETVAGKVKGLSMATSQIDGFCNPDSAWAYFEWTMEFRNDHESRAREARAQLQLPPGGVVSRLTLWVNGEEREAAFAGRGDHPMVSTTGATSACRPGGADPVTRPHATDASGARDRGAVRSGP